ncbi:MAG: archease [Anaerolineae bacterium]|nr:archease [Anaerolineae bacterium]
MATPPPFEELEHTADVGIRVWGADLDALFANAARGMMALTGAKADPAHPVRRTLALEAFDVETLLVDWLSELAYYLEAEHVAFIAYELQTTPTRLTATLTGGPVVALQRLIKAVTYHRLAVVPADGGFTATIIFDV